MDSEDLERSWRCEAELPEDGEGMTRLKGISTHVAGEMLNVEKHVKEQSDVCREMFRAAGSMFEQHLRFIIMFAAAGGGGYGGGGHKFPKAIMEHQYLRAVSGDKSLFRQRHQKFTTPPRQITSELDEIVQRLVKEICLGKELEKVRI